ncbi:MAG: DUF3035 domain-containing protein [Alphaproteobacteria bacterium]|nr:DUF3035 domain-containing protein [Alphaproteobacteria bacterium]
MTTVEKPLQTREYMMPLSRKLLLLGVSVLLLAACGETREDLGLGRSSPDEFAVVERPPLSMPPDFGLRPPRPGEPRPQAIDTDKQASAALFNGAAPAQESAPSDAEKALLTAAGVSKADSDIRETVDRESAQKVVASPHLVDRLLHWSDDQKPATTVDAAAEAERIKKAKEDNKPVTEGATPVIEKTTSGWLGL